jgi:hypothetical protein
MTTSSALVCGSDVGLSEWEEMEGVSVEEDMLSFAVECLSML